MTISADLRRRILLGHAKQRMREIIDFRDYRDTTENILIAAGLICDEPEFASIGALELATSFIDDIADAREKANACLIAAANASRIHARAAQCAAILNEPAATA